MQSLPSCAHPRGTVPLNTCSAGQSGGQAARQSGRQAASQAGVYIMAPGFAGSQRHMQVQWAVPTEPPCLPVTGHACTPIGAAGPCLPQPRAAAWGDARPRQHGKRPAARPSPCSGGCQLPAASGAALCCGSRRPQWRQPRRNAAQPAQSGRKGGGEREAGTHGVGSSSSRNGGSSSSSGPAGSMTVQAGPAPPSP